MSVEQRAVFPLSTVLFPGAILPMVIFEARYVDMVSFCMKHELPFIISKIIDGRDHGEPATFEPVGCFAHIVDFGTRDDGLLSIKVRGGERVEIGEYHVDDSKLLLASQVKTLEPVADMELPDELNMLSSLLERLSKLPEAEISLEPFNMNSAEYVVNHLAQVLPLDVGFKQHLLESNHPLEKSVSLFQQLVVENDGPET